MTAVRGGRDPGDELVAEFERRYEVIGGSPLIEITRAQATAVARALGWPVEVGMRFSEPSILAGLRRLADQDAGDVVAIIMSPQYSPMLMGGYARALEEARGALRKSAPRTSIAAAWHREPAFLDALATRVQEARGAVAADGRDRVAVLMTAHSLPRRVAEQEPEYLAQLNDTADAVAARAGLASEEWRFCWQSAGHEPGEWMTPDFADLMPQLAAGGCRAVVVAPVQFLADHLEVLYDIDIAARLQAERHGLVFSRIRSLNADPLLIEALAAVARRTMGATAAPAASRERFRA
jgi:ferrochelatase